MNHPSALPSPASLMPIAARPDVLFVRGQGAWLFDAAGRRYLDWMQGWAVNCLGHSPQVIVDAVAQQAATLLNPGPAFHNLPAMRLAEKLTTIPGGRETRRTAAAARPAATRASQDHRA